MGTTRPDTWNATTLRANLARAIKAAMRRPQIIEVDGRKRAVLVDFEQWQQIRGDQKRRQAVDQMWSKLEQLEVEDDDRAAFEDLPRPDWRNALSDSGTISES